MISTLAFNLNLHDDHLTECYNWPVKCVPARSCSATPMRLIITSYGATDKYVNDNVRIFSTQLFSFSKYIVQFTSTSTTPYKFILRILVRCMRSLSHFTLLITFFINLIGVIWIVHSYSWVNAAWKIFDVFSPVLSPSDHWSRHWATVRKLGTPFFADLCVFEA